MYLISQPSSQHLNEIFKRRMRRENDEKMRWWWWGENEMNEMVNEMREDMNEMVVVRNIINPKNRNKLTSVRFNVNHIS